jgi:hypothetical protein
MSITTFVNCSGSAEAIHESIEARALESVSNKVFGSQVINTSMSRSFNFDRNKRELALATMAEFMERSGAVVMAKFEESKSRGCMIGQLKNDVSGNPMNSPMLFICRGYPEAVWLTLMGLQEDPIKEHLESLREIFEGALAPADDAAAIRVMYQGSYGPEWYRTDLKCEEWEGLRPNYATTTANALDRYMAGEVDPSRGRLIIWHGEPGTGKTYAVRTFINIMKKTHHIVYLPDAMDMLGSTSFYYTSVNEVADSGYGFRRNVADPDAGDPAKRPILFLFEDAADPLLADMRAANGSVMAKMLNITDGILAQGRDDLFLVTFNEKIKDLDPAVVRPGRCNGIVEFKTFERGHANSWLQSHGSDLTVSDRTSIAELYSLINGGVEAPQLHTDKPDTFGFVK